MANSYLGIDVGSVSTNLAVIDEDKKVVATSYLRTEGQPINSIKLGLNDIKKKLKKGYEILAVGVTGSARELANAIVGADISKTEITAHAAGACMFVPEVRTIIEIGGQDSKIILLENGIVVDFAMNTVCAAGTGSFLEHQAHRINLKIEEFGDYALKSTCPVNIAGRCTVFAESDMIHKQQLGHKKEDIISGLCDALVRNYLNNVAKGKTIKQPIVFQGGVAANKGIKKAFEKALNQKIIVPEHFDVMGAIGVAVIAKERIKGRTRFKGFDLVNREFKTTSFECTNCPNSCEIIQVFENEKLIARYGDRCWLWQNLELKK